MGRIGEECAAQKAEAGAEGRRGDEPDIGVTKELATQLVLVLRCYRSALILSHQP